MTDVLLLADDAEDYARLMERVHVDDLTLRTASAADRVDNAALRCEVALGKPALLAEVIPEMPNLRWVQSTFAGVDPLLREGMPRDYVLTGVKDVFGPLMSEYVLAQMIARERGFSRLQDAQNARRWSPAPYRGLRGLTLAIAGLGSIGQHIATTGKHFGMRVIGYKRSPASLPEIDTVFSGDAFTAFVSEADFLVLTLPATRETTHIVNTGTLRAMKPEAWLINVGRGALVNEPDLAGALWAGVIAGATLDVFEQEPLPESSPLWNAPNCVVTPHVAAESFPEDIVGIFLHNWARYRDGDALDYRIDFTRGY